MDGAITSYHLSERRACRIVGQPRGTQRYSVIVRADEDVLTRAILELAAQYGRYGYRRIAILLKNAGWSVGVDRVQRIHRREIIRQHLRLRVLHVDLVDEAEVDDVHPELGILDLAENLHHFVARSHAASLEALTIPACSPPSATES